MSGLVSKLWKWSKVFDRYGAVSNRDDVNLGFADDLVNDAVTFVHNFAHVVAVELRYDATDFRHRFQNFGAFDLC